MSDPLAAFRLPRAPEIEVVVKVPCPDEAQLAMLREIVDGAPYRAHSTIWLHVEGELDRGTAMWLSFFGMVESAYDISEVRITHFGKAVLETMEPQRRAKEGLLQNLEAIVANVPEEEWKKLPRDFAASVDRELYSRDHHQEPVAVDGIWLKREKDHAVVMVEIDGRWIEVIRENIEGPFSHIVEPNGIRARER